MSLPEPPTLTTCYRHPDREAGRRCTRCGKPACSECLVQAAVGSQCLDCVRQSRPPLAQRVRTANARQNTLVTYALIGVNVAMFLWVAAQDSSTIGGFGDGRVSKRQLDLGLFRWDPHYADRWGTIVTSGFLHFGVIHLALNMYLLYLLGQLLEPALGRTRFALLYFACLLGGSAGVLIYNAQSVSGGASGAVFGLMSAAAVAMHRRGINILHTGIGRTLALNLVLTFLLYRQISVGGHLGGLVAGGLCSLAMMAPRWKPVANWITYAAPVAVAAASVAICVALVNATDWSTTINLG
jgi:membrane associated rhomboid family serine protease